MRNKGGFNNEHLQLESNEFLVQNRSKKCCTKHCFLQFCKKFLTFMISRVGLMIVMVGYVLAGGIIFETLESENENKSLKLSESVLERMLRRIYKQIESNSTRVRDESFYIFLRHEIREYSEFVTNATRNGTLTGNNDIQWDFFGSVFYCVTLVSTIGYGHITCKTKMGKAFTIVYSAIGIPLMMLFLANTGSSTATMFRFIYLKITSVKRRYRFRKITKENFLRSDFDNEFFDNNNEFMSLNEQTSNSNDMELDVCESKKSSFKSSLRSSSNKSKSSKKKQKEREQQQQQQQEQNEIYFIDSRKSNDNEKSVKLEPSSTNSNSSTTKNSKKSKSSENEKTSKHPNNEKSSLSSTASAGIRNVDIPNELLEKIFKKNSKSQDKESFNKNMLNIIRENSINFENTKILDALKRIDGLIDIKLNVDDTNVETNDTVMFSTDETLEIEESDPINKDDQYDLGSDDEEDDDLNRSLIANILSNLSLSKNKSELNVHYNLIDEKSSIKNVDGNNAISNTDTNDEQKNLSKSNQEVTSTGVESKEKSKFFKSFSLMEHNKEKKLKTASQLNSSKSEILLNEVVNSEILNESITSSPFSNNDDYDAEQIKKITTKNKKQLKKTSKSDEISNKDSSIPKTTNRFKFFSRSFKSIKNKKDPEKNKNTTNPNTNNNNNNTNDNTKSTKQSLKENNNKTTSGSRIENVSASSPNNNNDNTNNGNGNNNSHLVNEKKTSKNSNQDTNMMHHSLTTSNLPSTKQETTTTLATLATTNFELTKYPQQTDTKSLTSQEQKSIHISQSDVKQLKRNYSRSIYSVDYLTSKNYKKSKGKSKQISSYNIKQLHLIYRQYQQERQEKIGVPMLTTLIIMPCYLFCGMLIFSSFEEWRKLDALYFCFVTLTTIGFGDLIPGSTLLNKNGNKKNMYISALYIFIGLILIAMCINLMNKQLKNKIKSIAKKIGLSNC